MVGAGPTVLGRAMSDPTNRALAVMFGFVGAVLLILDGLFDFLLGAFFLAIRHPGAFVGSVAQAIVLVVVGLIVGLFTVVGRSRGRDESMAAGLILVVLALAGWFVLGFAAGVLSLVASICILIAGLLFLVASR
jgi:hypothetical protein